MTRVTNLGRKRTYVQAGFARDVLNSTPAHEGDNVENIGSSSTSHFVAKGVEKIHKMPRHTTKEKAKTSHSAMEIATQSTGYSERQTSGQSDGKRDDESPGEKSESSARKGKSKEGKKASSFSGRSEKRRLKRITERQVSTVCFACRQPGHAAKECPTTRSSNGKQTSGSVVGICYRCGSRRHTLSRCKKPEDPSNPLPFASCFVCSGKGHLASSCPQNKNKGIYPNGGSCKLCGDTTHLAKDCGLRKSEGNTNVTVMGLAQSAGADEDDFHEFKRRKVEVDKEEWSHERARKSVDMKVGAHSGIVKTFGKPAPAASTRKVVYF